MLMMAGVRNDEVLVVMTGCRSHEMRGQQKSTRKTEARWIALPSSHVSFSDDSFSDVCKRFTRIS
jgi:hypothetical protein